METHYTGWWDAGTGKFHVIMPAGVGAIWVIMCGQRLIFALIRAYPHWHPQGPSLSWVMKKNKPSWRLGFEVLLKSLRFSPCGHLSAATNKRGFVGSTVGALVKLVRPGHSLLGARRELSHLVCAYVCCLYIHLYIYIYVYSRIYTRIYMCVYIDTYIYTYVYIYMRHYITYR